MQSNGIKRISRLYYIPKIAQLSPYKSDSDAFRLIVTEFLTVFNMTVAWWVNVFIKRFHFSHNQVLRHAIETCFYKVWIIKLLQFVALPGMFCTEFERCSLGIALCLYLHRQTDWRRDKLAKPIFIGILCKNDNNFVSGWE